MSDGITLRARPHHTFAFNGASLLVTDIDGRVTGETTQGFFLNNTRLLSRDELLVDGKSLEPVAASPTHGNGHLSYWEVPQSEGKRAATVHVEIARLLDEGMRTDVKIENFSLVEQSLDVEWVFDADFADIDELETGKREHDAVTETRWDQEIRELTLSYRHPQLQRAVAIRIEKAPGRTWCKDASLFFSLDLEPNRPLHLEVSVVPIFEGKRRAVPAERLGRARTRLDGVREQLREQAPRLETTNPTVAQAWRTAVADLSRLPYGLSSGPAAPAAGIPLYQQLFGRDSLTIAWQATMAMPTMLRDALVVNAEWQGQRIDDWRDEEPGKMIHQARSGPLSILERNPFLHYYGDYATAPDFLIMLGQYLAWTNDRNTVHKLLPSARKAVEWLERYADLDRDGFIEYEKRSPKGVKNQGWKDADNAIVYESGEIVPDPIATSELQAYWYSGLRQAALALFVGGDRAYAAELLQKAKKLKRRFDQAFWMDEEQYYALALDADKRQVPSIASNAGHLLAAGIVPPSKARIVADRLLADDLFSGWGIRTLSTHHRSYNPFSYHLGAVWPVDAGTFCLGFGRYGLFVHLHRLAKATFDATELFAEHRLPEALGGIARDPEHPHPGIYPKANQPQGWSASAIVLIVQALLGLRPFAPLKMLLIDPQLPDWLPYLRLEGIRVGKGSVDLEARRTSKGRTEAKVLHKKGVLVVRQPAPQSDDSGFRARLSGSLRSVLGL